MTDPDAHLTQRERTRQALTRAVDRIVQAWPHALADAGARGFGVGRGYDSLGGAGELTSVEAAADVPCRAVAWLAELADVLAHVTGDANWPWFTARVGDTPAGIIGLAGTLMRQRVPQLVDEAWIARIITLGNKGALWWPTLASGDVVKGVTVGQRSNTVQNCALCGDPVLGGAGDPLRRIDDDVFHKSPCWYAASMSRGRHPRQECA